MPMDDELERAESFPAIPMKDPLSTFSRLYQSALRAHLAGKSRLEPETIEKFVVQVRNYSVSLPEFARLHENFLVLELLPGIAGGKQEALIRRAGAFFAAAIAATHADARNGAGKAIESLSGRNVELAAANRLLAKEIIRLGKVEAALRNSESDCRKSLEKSEDLKVRLRALSRQILSTQEDERKMISHELHDVIAQTLAMINLRLASMKTEAGINSKRLVRNISLTQKMITKSAESVYQFARELRPAALDDLGLIPALHSLMRAFTKRTGVRTHLTVFKGVEKLSAVKRTVIYRISQEAITNVGRHARAESVEVRIRREAKFVQLVVIDDGISFQAGQTPPARGKSRLGLLGMRERVEMIGGSFEIESAPGKGTKIIARIPISKATEKRWLDEPAEISAEIP